MTSRVIIPLHGFFTDHPMASISSNPWRVRGRDVTVDKPVIVGILNVTPDSFSDGGRFTNLQAAVDRVGEMISEGADVIDIGGESTRPQQATEISEDEESARVVPVIEAIRPVFPHVLMSIDTTKSAVARQAIDLGVDIVNDVSGFRLDRKMGEVVSDTKAGVVLMHSRGGVSEMGTYKFANYRPDVVGEIGDDLRGVADAAIVAGVDRQAIVLDPGVGFAKRSEHSLRVLAELHRIVALGFPVMVGVSRKRFIGELSRVQVAAERVFGTIGANVAALIEGARLFRVHDVAANRQALDVAWGIIEVGRATRTQFSTAADSRFPIPDSR
jgi:dihydropteroate synthase